jgi:hypothetical protein
VQKRELAHRDLDEVLAELDRLRAKGYERAGAWDLAQIADHLTYFIQGSLDGFTFRVPWLLKVLFGRFFLRRILKQRRMRASIPTPQKPLPEPGGDEVAAVARLREVIERLKAHPGELHDSPFFGHLTPQQWREFHTIHCAHHLAFLIPKAPAP